MRGGNSKGLLNICRLKYHYVYQTKNLINGKTYIGRHSTDNLNDGYIGSGKMLKRAIQKYGKENFECIPMCYFDTYEDSVEEEKFIVTRNYCKRKDNYNIVEGGANPIMYGELNPSTGRKRSEEEKLKYRFANLHNYTPIEVDGIFYDSIASCVRNTNEYSWYAVINKCVSDDYPNYKFVRKEDYLEYYLKYKKKDKLPNTQSVKVMAENIEFESIYKCSEYYNINVSTVDSRCISPHFKDWKYLDKAHQKKREEIYYIKVNKRYARKRAKTAENKKPVMIIEGKFYYSFKEAGRDYGIWYETVQRRGVLDEFPDWVFPTQEDIDKYKAKFEIIDERERNRVRVYKKKK